MRRIETEILVVGGGLAGLAATAALAAEGFATLCVDPAPVAADEHAAGADLRSTAFLMPSVALLERAGLWAALEPHAAPLRLMRILEDGGPGAGIRTRAEFDAAEIGEPLFGWNLPNWLIRREMLARLSALPGAMLRQAGFVAMVPRLRDIVVRLSDGTQVRARLVVAADGRDSAVRRALGIPAPRIGYGQKAVVFAVSCTLPHQGVSTEIHRAGGPFTLVPLPDRDGVPHAAVVWMEDGPRAAELATMPVQAFETELNARACGVLGRLGLATPRALWPIISQIAARFDGPRSLLVAEAAHVMPPIGAQGLNTSLRDVALLRDLLVEARAAGADIGAPELLARHARRRRAEAALRIAGIDLLNRASQAGARPLREMRRLGLEMLHRTGPLRRLAMRAGMGRG
ncbi:MAG: UbiH/UbiF family hydroxylase [Alphaproteobacteria bacterium]|nr:MAG: UbiH/UbiF family hydroxylase [Alphaproteobacteria bacterium]